MKIIDAFIFFNEIDTLKIRLSLLYEKVDTFVICESNITHSGSKKNYNFLEHKDEFSSWMDKIVFIKFEPDISNLDFSKKDLSYNPSSPAWKIEVEHRNCLANFLSTQDSNDIAVVCDVDEIWNPSLSDFLRSGQIHHEAARLEMQFHYYHLNCIGVGESNSKWAYPFFAKVGYINSNPNLSKIRLQATLPVIENAGWHFSYLGGAKKVSEKINAFAHQETNTEEINDLKHLEQCINLGIDHLARAGHEWAFYPIDRYPENLKKVMRKFPHLIKSTLI